MLFAGCMQYDDSSIKEDIEDLENRVASLETWQKEANANLSVLSDIVRALQGNDYITSVTDIKDNS